MDNFSIDNLELNRGNNSPVLKDDKTDVCTVDINIHLESGLFSLEHTV